MKVIKVNSKQKIDQAAALALLDNLDASDKTIANYKRSAVRFIDHLDAEGINANSLLDFKRRLAADNNLSVSSKNKYLHAARQLARVAHSNNLLPVDITKANGISIKGFKQGRLHKKDGLTEAELKAVAGYLNGLDGSLKSIRLKLMFSLLFNQGLRQIEVCRLRVSDIDLPAKKAFILGKGRDDREPVPLQDSVVRLIKRYLKASGRRDGHLFYALAGGDKSRQLKPGGIYKQFRALFRQLGIDKTPHALRHSFTTRMLKFYDDILVVASYTRHRSLEMVRVYADELNKEADRPNFNKAFEALTIA